MSDDVLARKALASLTPALNSLAAASAARTEGDHRAAEAFQAEAIDLLSYLYFILEELAQPIDPVPSRRQPDFTTEWYLYC